jgi:hypothetical protein
MPRGELMVITLKKYIGEYESIGLLTKPVTN